MSVEAARLGAALGAAGLAALLVAPQRYARLAGLAAVAVGGGLLAGYLVPSGSEKLLAAGLAVGAPFAAAGAYALRRFPWALPFAALACVPARIPVDVGDTEANLLLPLYAVIAAAGVALAWSLLRGEGGTRELGIVAWPLAAFVALDGFSLAWSDDPRQGGITLLFFVLPFGVLAVCLSRLPWRRAPVGYLLGLLAAMAVAFAAIGVYQWVTRDVFWNPKVIVGNAYAPFYRVNSVFWDPSIYGRFLVVAILAALVGLVIGGVRSRLVFTAAAVIAVAWVGLLFSFSQSSFAALIAGTLAAAAFVWRWRAVTAVALAGVVLLSAGMAAPSVRHSIFDASDKGLNRATSGRFGLITDGAEIAFDHPAGGVGVGGFKRAYAEKTGLRGEEPKKAASHNTPVTVAAELGFPGLAVLAWLLVAGLLAAFRRAGRGFEGRAALVFGIALGAIAVHSLFYDAFFEDPMTWGLLALGAVVAREPDVIAGWKRVLVLAPHTDDGEFGCGGTMARLVESGAEVRYVAFSIATKSLPEGFPPDTLAREVREATAELGIPESALTVHDFEVRTFPERRQDILELLIALWDEWHPDAVFQPSLHDVHQDHQVVAAEGLRAFKRTTVMGYEIPWNNFDFAYQAYVALERSHLERKTAALAKYASQQHRRYADPEYMWNLARTHGVNVNREYAECFQVYRVVA